MSEFSSESHNTSDFEVFVFFKDHIVNQEGS